MAGTEENARQATLTIPRCFMSHRGPPRWSRLDRFEPRILDTLGARPIPDPGRLSEMAMLRLLTTERDISNAIRNLTSPVWQSGHTCDDPSLNR